jgi:hypothetical protein
MQKRISEVLTRFRSQEKIGKHPEIGGDYEAGDGTERPSDSDGRAAVGQVQNHNDFGADLNLGDGLFIVSSSL